MEFKAFPKIERIGKMNMHITQKIHGSNAQIFIYKEEGQLKLLCGSRNRWITPEDDNYGFAKMVYANKDEFISKLGVGQHFGEWAGPGINSGEGLKEKTFVLFDFWKFPPERALPPNTVVVPVLYQGEFDIEQIEQAASILQKEGSKLCPGFMAVEGVVVSINGTRYKKVFTPEETAWKAASRRKDKTPQDIDVSHLVQPIRLEKLLSRDERYLSNYPNSLGSIVKDYIQDMLDEGALTEEYRKPLAREMYNFIKETVKV